MTSTTRKFPTEVVASLSTGVLLCDFSQMHEAAEYLMGHPIWTHHFASKELWNAMRDKIVAQHPDMPIKIEGVTPENCPARVRDLHAKLGAEVMITKGDGRTAMSPLDGIPDGKPPPERHGDARSDCGQWLK